MSMVILARGHGSGSVDKQCSNSEVRSEEMTGRASPCGRWSTAGSTVPLLFCVWVRAAICTAWMVDLYWLTIALKYSHARTAALLVFGPSSG